MLVKGRGKGHRTGSHSENEGRRYISRRYPTSGDAVLHPQSFEAHLYKIQRFHCSPRCFSYTAVTGVTVSTPVGSKDREVNKHIRKHKLHHVWVAKKLEASLIDYRVHYLITLPDFIINIDEAV